MSAIVDNYQLMTKSPVYSLQTFFVQEAPSPEKIKFRKVSNEAEYLDTAALTGMLRR